MLAGNVGDIRVESPAQVAEFTANESSFNPFPCQMTVRRNFFVLTALLVLLLGAGCSDRSTTPFAAETDEPNFRQGQQRLREGRAPEALTLFLKVIKKRGEQYSPESHLEAGLIYLQHIKDPIEAIHHFRKYLELLPNSLQASLVRQRVEAATREFAVRLPARPGDDQSVRIEIAEELERLRRDNTEMRAELATLRGGGAVPVVRTPRMLTLPGPSRPAAVVPSPVSSPILLAPEPRPAVAAQSLIQPAPTPASAPAVRPPAPATKMLAPAGKSPTAARTHTVAPGESPWSIARKYYGPGANALKVQGIFDANRDVLSEAKNLKPGMTLRIPNP